MSLVKNLTDAMVASFYGKNYFSSASRMSIVIVDLKMKLSILKINRDLSVFPVAMDREKEEILLSRSSIYAKTNSLGNLAVLSP
jgi:hypothetical protein